MAHQLPQEAAENYIGVKHHAHLNPAVSSMLPQQYLHGIIDLAVRSLDPSTENTSRESYKAIHPHPSRPHQVDVLSCCDLFNWGKIESKPLTTSFSRNDFS